MVFGLESIAMLAQQRGGRVLWADDSGPTTWTEFGAAVEAARRQCVEQGVQPGEVVLTPGEAELDSLAWLMGAASAGAVVAPLRRERVAEIESWADDVEIRWRVLNYRISKTGTGMTSAGAAQLLGLLRDRKHPGLILATGGTTGRAKLVLHDLDTLLATVPTKMGRPWRTLPLMRFDHIGGLDIAWRALAGGQILVAPPAALTPEAVAAKVARHRVDVLPATPSFLNLLLMADVHRTHDLSSLRVVPYGAEPMPSGLLRRLRVALPQVEFVQRFGTSETGALPVRDTGPGLVLDAGETGCEWKLVEGELWVRSPARGLGYLSGGDNNRFTDAGWFRTGDVAEQAPDGTVRVLGRREELINIGGEKVLPSSVESVLLTHPLIADCRVLPLANAVLGQVVAAQIVWQGAQRDPVMVKRMVHEFAVTLLPKCHLPTVVRLVDAIETTRNLKKNRSTNQ
jgi:acyl-CoA synthetase (AMP-forming)/AMP-acid ligase II